MTGPRRLDRPAPRARARRRDGQPLAVDGRASTRCARRGSIEDRWWTDAPLRRRYWEVVTTDGRDVVVFHDLDGGGWFVQR